MSTAERRIVVLISGSGSNLQALMDGCTCTPALLPHCQVSLVISNRKAAYGLVRASQAGIPTDYLALQPFLKQDPSRTRQDYDTELARRILSGQPHLIVLAGFMHVLSAEGLKLLEGIPIINLHPALPGAFDGANAIPRALSAYKEGRVTTTGCMVHHVIPEVDAGPPIVIREIAIDQQETLETLETKIHAVEHEIIVEAARVVLAS
ncbi:uncharacterized protein L969DRAFT_58174 [Mixia osmundae IAM 14324]|uniref:phosphoribosylglycinamide formyltransferase 1 n=1 Tax=Mixia osmundae (strain CBS 9802 / IAM 14324 / JCM 22182 / KY 12970) TaxID=764103 RepID=G7DXE6_MIXOS|nr:uncharacterized protein L969DRAFT_58174 [Mixia osmundae IAM 14324]KEI41250.1 hypothetical protein L969DRAFT_58174 [Mixia osmundae IAM 14324]GAA95256.1 hypothetical protein E5Q_01912 [Mixia osmundae IAM 14324]